jgi:hypothetical protein
MANINPNPVSPLVATPIGASVMNAIYNTFGGTNPAQGLSKIPARKDLKMLQSDLAGGDMGIDPEVFGKDLTPALNAFNDRAAVAESSRNKTYSLDKPVAILGEGKFRGVKLTKEMIDDAFSAAKKYKRDPFEVLAIMGQESTFSQSGIPKEKRGLDQRSMTSGWNTSEDYVPYRLERFLADKQVPGIGKTRIKGKDIYSIDDLDAVKAAVAKRTGLMEQYMKKIAKTPIAAENYIDMAARFVNKKGLANYNSKDKDYVEDVMNSKALLQKDKVLMQYLKSRGLR